MLMDLHIYCELRIAYRYYVIINFGFFSILMSPDEITIFAQQSSLIVLLIRTCGHHISYNVLAFSESQGTFSMLQLCTSMLRVIIY